MGEKFAPTYTFPRYYRRSKHEDKHPGTVFLLMRFTFRMRHPKIKLNIHLAPSVRLAHGPIGTHRTQK